jgi:hypothetical protein
VTQSAVAVDDTDVAASCGVEGRSGTVHDVVVDVDRCDVAVHADEVREQTGVVSGAGADLQHPVARFDLKLFEHHRHHGGL